MPAIDALVTLQTFLVVPKVNTEVVRWSTRPVRRHDAFIIRSEHTLIGQLVAEHPLSTTFTTAIRRRARLTITMILPAILELELAFSFLFTLALTVSVVVLRGLHHVLAIWRGIDTRCLRIEPLVNSQSTHLLDHHGPRRKVIHCISSENMASETDISEMIADCDFDWSEQFLDRVAAPLWLITDAWVDVT